MTDDISELVRRLRRYPDREDNVPVLHLCADAADALERLDAVANEWARVASRERNFANVALARAEAAEADLAKFRNGRFVLKDENGEWRA